MNNSSIQCVTLSRALSATTDKTRTDLRGRRFFGAAGSRGFNTRIFFEYFFSSSEARASRAAREDLFMRKVLVSAKNLMEHPSTDAERLGSLYTALYVTFHRDISPDTMTLFVYERCGRLHAECADLLNSTKLGLRRTLYEFGYSNLGM